MAQRLIDLTQEWYPGMPHWPTHPPFAMARTKEHGDYVTADGISSAAELLALGTHVGTHIDGLGHFSCGGAFHQGRPFEELGIGSVAPLFCAGTLFDAAPGGSLAEGDEISVEDLRRAQRGPLHAGGAALVRTGWGRRWHDARLFINEQRQPGLSLEAADWLASHGVAAIGADNVALERIPTPRMSVHVRLLVELGIHILECLDLEELAAAAPSAFTFAGAPLKLRGATGAPLRAFALVD